MRKVRVIYDATFDNVETWFEATSNVQKTHSCIPYPTKLGDNKKVIVLVLGDKSERK